jgi:hypothetical protein
MLLTPTTSPGKKATIRFGSVWILALALSQERDSQPIAAGRLLGALVRFGG